ncbi:unnamed protein product [Ectocarpus sp. 4 AP-2014]
MQAAGSKRLEVTTNISAATAPAPSHKKSCDLCVARKVKCSGATPCSFCTSRGSECHYSRRRPNRPRRYSTRSISGLGYRNGEKEGVVHQGKAEMPIASWKRARLSASPATGLVGMKENELLNSFFSCFGFFPLTHESLVRGTIMEVVLVPPVGAEDVAPRRLAGAWGKSEPRQGTDTASTCTLWCAVAIGALVQGQPTERVIDYLHLARTSVSHCFDMVTVETARAFMMMAYLFNFLRNEQMFHRYLQFAKGVMERLHDTTSQTQQELYDLLARGDDTRIYHTGALEAEELEAYCVDDEHDLELPDVIGKRELCRLLLQTDRRLIKAYLRDHRAQIERPLEGRTIKPSSGGEGETPTEDDPDGGGQKQERLNGGPRVGGKWMNGATGGGAGDVSEKSDEIESVAPIDTTKMNDEAEPSRPGEETRKCLREAQVVFSKLKTTAKAPEVGAGIGGLIFNAISAYLDITTGSTKLGAEKIKLCAKIFVRYPGLCRFSRWLHLSHCLLTVLATLEDAEPFEELRKAYNSVRTEDLAEVPEQKAWTMVGFCNHIFCRSFHDLGQKETNTTEMGPDRGTVGAEEQHKLTSQEEGDRWACAAAITAPSEFCRDQAWLGIRPGWVEGELPEKAGALPTEFLPLDSVASFHGDHPSRKPEARTPTFLSAAGFRAACDHDSHRTHAGGCCPERGAVANDSGTLDDPGAVAPFLSSSGPSCTAAYRALPSVWQEHSGLGFPIHSRPVEQRRSTTWRGFYGGSDVAML